MLLLELAIIFGLIMLNAVFAGAEIAVVAAHHVRLQQRAAEGSRRAKAVLDLRANPERFFATVQVGISVIGATAGAFGGATFAEDLEALIGRWIWLGPHAETISVAAVVVIVSYLSIVIGELVPKSLALKHADTYSLLVGRALLGLSWIAKPLIKFLSVSSNLILKPFGDQTTFTEAKFSAEELQDLVDEAKKSGTVDAQVGDIASRALELEGLTAKDVMIPRNRIDGIPISCTSEQLQQLILERGHERMPIYKGNLDNIIGYLIVKDILAMVWQKQLIVLQDLLRPVFYVHEGMLARRILSEFQRQQTQLAIVIDEHGGVLGLITVEDILEELVGDLYDEREAPDQTIMREGESALVKGHVSIREANRALEIDLPDGASYGTLAGLCLHLCGGVPMNGTRLVLEGVATIEVVEASARVVRLVRVTPNIRAA